MKGGAFVMRAIAAMHRCLLLLVLAIWLGSSPPALGQTDPLPSWNEGPAKKAIVEFVQATTDKASLKFVPPEARIATLCPWNRVTFPNWPGPGKAR